MKLEQKAQREEEVGYDKSAWTPAPEVFGIGYPEDEANDAEQDARVGAVEQLEERAEHSGAQLRAHPVRGLRARAAGNCVSSDEVRRQLHQAVPRQRLEQRRRGHQLRSRRARRGCPHHTDWNACTMRIARLHVRYS